MNWQDFTWILVGMSIVGNIFVNKKNVIGQWLWVFANIGWMFYDISVGSYSQASLFAIYFFMSLWGVYSWMKDEKIASNPILSSKG